MIPKRVIRWNVVLLTLAFCAADVARGVNPDPPLPDPSGINKVKFISFRIPPAPQGEPVETALRIWMVSLHNVVPPYSGTPSIPFTLFEGESVWVGPPANYIESNANPVPFRASMTQCAPHYRDWTTVGLLHVTGAHIAPSSIYEVEQVPLACEGTEDSCATVSTRLEIRTNRWGDVQGDFNPPSTTAQPDVNDCASLVAKFQNKLTAPIKARVMLFTDAFGNISTSTLTNDMGFSQIAMVVFAFRGDRYLAKMGRCGPSPMFGHCHSGDSDIDDAPCLTLSDCTAAGQSGPCTFGPSIACASDSDCGANGPCNLYCP